MEIDDLHFGNCFHVVQMMQFVLPDNGSGVLMAVQQYMDALDQTAAELLQQATLTPFQTYQLCSFLLNVSQPHQYSAWPRCTHTLV